MKKNEKTSNQERMKIKWINSVERKGKWKNKKKETEQENETKKKTKKYIKENA